MNSSLFLWEIIVTTIETTAVFLLLKNMLGLEKKKIVWAILAFVGSVIVTSIQNYIDIDLNINIFNGVTIYQTRWINMIYFVLATVAVFKSSISKKIMWGLVPTFVIAISDFFAFTMLSSATNLPASEVSQYSQNRIFGTLIYLIISCIIYFLLIMVNRNKLSKEIILPLNVRLLLIINLTIGIIAIDQLVDLSLYSANINDPQYVSKASFIAISFFIIVSSMFILVTMLGKVLFDNAAYMLANERSNLEKKYYLKLEQSYNGIREMKHDMRNHVKIMQGLMHKNDMNGLAQHFESVSGIYTPTDRIFTSNIPIDILISNKYDSIMENKIKPTFSIEELDSFTANYTDLCSILGNIFDNAIEACCKVENTSHRFINFALCKMGNMLMLDMKNSSDGIYLTKKHTLLSRKKTLNHGIGLRIVEKNVAKYGGHYVVNPDASTFSIQVVLPLEQFFEKTGGK